MEKNGIGTDASMATHINNICDREYVKVVGGRKL
jgi:DNA topoisomerase-3